MLQVSMQRQQYAIEIRAEKAVCHKICKTEQAGCHECQSVGLTIQPQMPFHRTSRLIMMRAHLGEGLSSLGTEAM